MRRIPAFVTRRNRNASYAEEQAQGYKERPAIVERGPCQHCHRLESDHFAGMCDDWKPYEPPPAAGAVSQA